MEKKDSLKPSSIGSSSATRTFSPGLEVTSPTFPDRPANRTAGKFPNINYNMAVKSGPESECPETSKTRDWSGRCLQPDQAALRGPWPPTTGDEGPSSAQRGLRASPGVRRNFLQRGSQCSMLTTPRTVRRLLSSLRQPQEGVKIVGHVSCKRKMAFFVNALTFLVFMFVIFILGSKTSERVVSVQTREGVVEGLHLNDETTLNRDVFVFLGVPYGRDTSGSHRFSPPRPAVPRVFPLHAKFKGPPCPQGSGAPVLDMIPTESSEDCLHLNIWTPVVRPFCAFDCNPRTVILFFYGRDFEHGFNNLDLYDGRALSARGDVLVVVPNYRLGVFGFLNAHTADAPGNVGLLDMLLALKWVQENIDAFAGDPKNIVLFGHDTGATSLGYFLLQPGLLKAHRRLILHSGSPLRPLRDNTASALANLRALAESASCPASAGDPGGSVDCLRNLTVPELQRATDRLRIALGPRFVPSFDSFPMTESPFGMARSELFEDKQVLVASVVDEGAFEIGVLERTYLWGLADNQTAMGIGLMAALEQYLNERDPNNNGSDSLHKFAEELEQKRLKSKQLVKSAWRDFLGNFFFDCPLEYWAQNLTSASKLHLFRFRHRPRPNAGEVAARNDDLELVFGRPLITGVTGTMSDLSNKVIDFWSYFARTGSLPAVSKAVQWPQFKAECPARIEVFDTGFVTYKAGVSESCRQLMPLIYPRVHGWDAKTAVRPKTFPFLGERHGR